MLFCFISISAEILLHILGYCYWAEYHILAHLCKVLLPSKASELSVQKLLCSAAKNVGVNDPSSPS